MDRRCFSVSTQRVCPHVSVLRLHEGPDRKLGDPWSWCCAVTAGGVVVPLHPTVIPPDDHPPDAYALTRQKLCEHVSVIRAHPVTDGREPEPTDPCVWASLMESVAHLFATMAHGYPRATRILVGEMLNRLGFTRRFHERIRDGKTHYVFQDVTDVA